jgi:hypothetical protein
MLGLVGVVPCILNHAVAPDGFKASESGFHLVFLSMRIKMACLHHRAMKTAETVQQGMN